MKYKVSISAQALREIEEALAHTAKDFGRRKHEQYQRLLEFALDAIESFPTTYPARHRPEILSNAWTYHIERRGMKARHLFGYVVAENGLVTIVCLVHDSADIRSKFQQPL